MGILLVVIGLTVFISIISLLSVVSVYSHRSFRRNVTGAALCTAWWAIAVFVLYGAISAGTLVKSYNSYLDARAYYDNVISQYKGAVTLYEDKAVALDMETAAKHAFTDLRFQGYQNKMAEFILDLRRTITRYNKCIIKKRLMDKNFFYSWYIIPPDKDMKTIDIISK